MPKLSLQIMLLPIQIQSSLSPGGHPAINRHPDNMDSSYIPGKNKLHTIDWNKFPLLQTLANEDVDSSSLLCPL